MACLYRALMFLGVLLAEGINAQNSQMFEWGFTGTQYVSTSLPSCRSFPLEVDARTANGTPPFYMMAFAVHGTPITSFIGTNQSNLTWTVTHPVGSQLALGVVDSQGHSGGFPSTLYTVIDGSTTDCVPATTSETSFKITANVTDVLTTCQPWGLTIQGGTPPYNITIATLDSANVTNVTLGATDTVFTYINRAPPKSQLIASASDLNGRWATGSPFVSTQGSSNTDCIGLGTTSSIGSVPSRSMSHRRIGIIAGASAAALVVCGMIIAMVLRRRRMKREHRTKTNIAPFFDSPALIPRTIQTLNPRTVQDVHLLPGSRGTSKTGSRHTSETESPLSSPAGVGMIALPVVHELPPPYPNFLNHAHES